MAPNPSAQIFLILAITTPIKCQFEFQDLQIVHELVADAVDQVQISCIVILRPSIESASEKSAIDGLTYGFAKNFQSRKKKTTVMSYTTELYTKSYMNPQQRKKDICIYWITVIMVTNSTNAQLIKVSFVNTIKKQLKFVFSFQNLVYFHVRFGFYLEIEVT